MKITAATFLILTSLLVGCDTYKADSAKPIPIKEAVAQIARNEGRVKVEDGYDLEYEGFYIVHCRDGVVWKSGLRKTNSELSMLAFSNDMLVMVTLDSKSLLIPVTNIHHIEFVGEYIKKE